MAQIELVIPLLIPPETVCRFRFLTWVNVGDTQESDLSRDDGGHGRRWLKRTSSREPIILGSVWALFHAGQAQFNKAMTENVISYTQIWMEIWLKNSFWTGNSTWWLMFIITKNLISSQPLVIALQLCTRQWGWWFRNISDFSGIY